MEVISFLVEKGGTGKSTSSMAFADSLSKRGYKVLLIELDAQGSTGFVSKADSSQGIFEVLTGQKNINDVIQHTQSFDIITANRKMGSVGEHIPGNRKAFALKDAIGKLKTEYDFIFCDCPPLLSVTNYNALVASDKIIIPIQADILSLKGIGDLIKTVNEVRRSANPTLSVDGILLTRYNPRTKMAKAVKNQAEQASARINSKVYDQWIRENVAVVTAQGNQMMLLDFDKRSNSAQDYEKVIDQFLKERGLMKNE